ncbi:toprim domain-containing protein [Sandarakinorhabdus sp.]|uniref:toprim domain-containing protein n=1 Tax=Sandarakinorhabdus sp. TaxID=1916663 RepID=UPI003F70186E
MIGNAADLVGSFMATMAASGITPANAGAVSADLLQGGLVRFACHGERKPNGWAVLFLDRSPAGAFGNWRLGKSGSWRAGGHAPAPFCGQSHARMRAMHAETRLALQQDVAAEAERLWHAAQPASADHPYLAAKRMAGDGLRQSGRVLLVPMHDADGQLWNLQRIYADGSKRFLKGGRVAGLLWRRGTVADAPLVIGEGVATMASVHAATGLPVAAAISANNLGPIARAMAARHPACRLILAADIDPNETGQRAAREAAALVGAGIAWPPKPPGWPDGKGWDFADAWSLPGGAEAIRAAFSVFLSISEERQP